MFINILITLQSCFRHLIDIVLDYHLKYKNMLSSSIKESNNVSFMFAPLAGYLMLALLLEGQRENLLHSQMRIKSRTQLEMLLLHVCKWLYLRMTITSKCTFHDILVNKKLKAIRNANDYTWGWRLCCFNGITCHFQKRYNFQ